MDTGPAIRRSLVLIVSAACGVMADPSRSALAYAARDACHLLDRETIEKVFGAWVSEGKPGVAGRTVTTCSFRIKSGGSTSILFRRDAGELWIAEQEQRMNMAIRYGTFHPVAGLGRKAYMLDLGRAGVALCVFGADYYLQVSVSHAGAAGTVFPLAEKLAKAVLIRLGSPSVPQTAVARGTTRR